MIGPIDAGPTHLITTHDAYSGTSVSDLWVDHASQFLDACGYDAGVLADLSWAPAVSYLNRVDEPRGLYAAWLESWDPTFMGFRSGLIVRGEPRGNARGDLRRKKRRFSPAAEAVLARRMRHLARPRSNGSSL